MTDSQGASPLDLSGSFWGPIIAGQVRHAVTVGAGILVGAGALDKTNEDAFIKIGVGLVMWAIIAGWSWWQKVGQKRALALLTRAKTPAAKALVLFAVFVTALISVHPASAATKKTPAPTIELPCIGTTNLPLGCKPAAQVAANAAENIANSLAQPFLNLANFIANDSGAAIALSTAVPGAQDGNGQACWMQMQSFAALIKAHPIPVTLKVESDIEALRLAEITANNVCASNACSTVFNDLTNLVQKAAPVSVALPITFSSICSQIPQIQVVPPAATTAAVTPAAATAPTTSPTK